MEGGFLIASLSSLQAILLMGRPPQGTLLPQGMAPPDMGHVGRLIHMLDMGSLIQMRPMVHPLLVIQMGHMVHPLLVIHHQELIMAVLLLALTTH